MEQHNIKKKLEERRIAPSEDSWNTLEAMLDTNDHKPRRKYFWHYAISACVLLLLGLLFFMNPENEIIPESQTIVNEEPQKVIDDDAKQQTNKNEKIAVVPTVAKNDARQEKVEQVIAKKEAVVAKDKKPTESLKVKVIYNEEKAVAKVSEQKLKSEVKLVVEEKPVVAQVIKDDIIKTEIKSAVAEVTAKKVAEITDEELDKLLKEGQFALDSLKMFTEFEYTVNADNLLDEVEYDLDRSFKEKVFEIIKKQFKKDNTSVVNRN